MTSWLNESACGGLGNNVLNWSGVSKNWDLAFSSVVCDIDLIVFKNGFSDSTVGSDEVQCVTNGSGVFNTVQKIWGQIKFRADSID